MKGGEGMTLRHLRIFVAVADLGKMSAAAKALFLSQSTVSQAIAELEAHYQTRLFERLGKRLYLTESARRLLSYARPLLALFGEMEQQMGQHNRVQRLHVGATMTIGACLLTGLVDRFEAAYPQVEVTCVVDNTRAVAEGVSRNALDLGFVEGQVHAPELAVAPVLTDELVLILPPDHPLGRQGRVHLAHLADQPMILREEGSGTRELFLSACRQQGVPVREKWSCHGAEAIKSAVMGGQGLSVISGRLVQGEAEAGRLAVRPIEGARLVRDFSLVHHRNKFLSEPIRRFMDLCRQLG